VVKGRISKRSVDALECGADKDRVFLWDENLTGFGLAAFPGGTKTYVVQYRRGGRTHRVAIGEHGRLTPDEARSEAKKLLGAVEQGVDPVAVRRAEGAIRLFREVALEFLELHVKQKRKSRTHEAYSVLLRRHVLPALGGLRITEVRRIHVTKMQTNMRVTPGAANRAVSLVSAVWNWAARRDEVSFAENPARAVEKYREKGKERFLTADEMRRLGDALRMAETEGLQWDVDETKPKSKHLPEPQNRRTLVDPFAVAAIRLLVFTGARLREILHAKWSQIDFQRGIIHLPDSKAGPKPIYLSAAALSILSAMPRLADNPHLIPGRQPGGHRADLKSPWAAVARAAGLEGVRIHDLRHSFASVGAGASLGLPIIGRLLGHSQPSTTARYAHLDADPMRRAADTIGAVITAAMDERKSTAVVSIHRVDQA
jgi:integrase